MGCVRCRESSYARRSLLLFGMNAHWKARCSGMAYQRLVLSCADRVVKDTFYVYGLKPGAGRSS